MIVIVIMVVMMMMMIGSMHYHITIDALLFPDDFDSFLEMLFEHAECEDFLSDDKWSTVGLRDCKPYVCNFPRELCRRPAAKYQDETSNTCSRIPEKCLTAANGGTLLTTDATSIINNEITNSNIDESELTTVTSSLSTFSNGSFTEAPSSIPTESTYILPYFSIRTFTINFISSDCKISISYHN
uniref:FZ domain-containing protein n=1 Tax=Elaeophora elaphi TaxID=1147741 RepID=A0A0R3RND8_9BILA